MRGVMRGVMIDQSSLRLIRTDISMFKIEKLQLSREYPTVVSGKPRVRGFYIQTLTKSAKAHGHVRLEESTLPPERQLGHC